MLSFLVRTAAVSMAAAGLMLAQTGFPVEKAELSVPFGSATGYVLAVDGDIVFVNEEKPDMSLHIRKADIATRTVSDDTLIVITSKPVAGLSEFRFRIEGGAEGFQAATTGAGGTLGAGTAAVAAKPQASLASVSFQVRHKHFPRGGCDGVLIVNDERISFESMTDVGHSRQWTFKDIKQLKRNNPYELTINPFDGSELNFEVQGSGMSSEQYAAITAKVAESRSKR